MTNCSKLDARAMVGLVAAAGLVLVAVAGCSLGTSGPDTPAAPPSTTGGTTTPGTQPPATPRSADTAAAATALSLNALQVVSARPNVPGYERDCGPGEGCVFGPAWTDVDRNGCDTRNDVLAAQLTAITYKPGTHDCVVATGTLADPYTGTTISFVRGPKSADVQVDHVLPEALAWDLGAAAWTLEQRTAFANDATVELLAVSGPANQSKSDSGPGEWLPSNVAYRCTYVTEFVTVLTKYRLPVTAADKAAIATVLTTCD